MLLWTDITQAAGWKVWKCNPEWAEGEKDVLMVCDGTAEQVALCQHVYENGAENMFVRLPMGVSIIFIVASEPYL